MCATGSQARSRMPRSSTPGSSARSPRVRRRRALALARSSSPRPRRASEERPTAAELEAELVCPVCETTLDPSDAPVARRMKAFIRQRIAAGDTKSEIKATLVDQFGAGVLAVPPKQGFDLLAWLLPLAGLALGVVVVGALAWRWSRRAAATTRRRRPRGAARSRARATARRRARPLRALSGTAVVVAFGAGFVSFLAPCVLPLVPGYLSAVSSVEAERLGEPGASRRVVVSSLPFVAGLVTVFVLLGAGAAAVGLSFTATSSCSSRSPASSWSSSASPSWACCRGRSGSSAPASSRVRGAAAPASCSAARSRSAPRRASARCSPRSSCSRATPTRSGRARSCSRSTRSGSPSRSCSPAALFAPAMGVFRWVRDHYEAIQFVSGADPRRARLLLFRRVLAAPRLPEPVLRGARDLTAA